MIKGHEPATGFVDNRSSSYEDNEVHYGLTIREHFANSAPEIIPTFFKHTPPEKALTEIDVRELSAEDDEIYRQWKWDPIFDLPVHLQWLQNAHNRRWEEQQDWETRNEAARYFQWRTFYADALIAELNKQP